MNATDQKNDDVEGLLHAFYRAELPHPWPEAACLHNRADAGLVVVRPQRRRQSWWNSRFALAASIAMLLLGSLVLSSFRATTRNAAGDPKNETAKPAVPLPRTSPADRPTSK